jgi:hypothetical protein
MTESSDQLGEEEGRGNGILCVKPRGCEPCVLAALFEARKLCIVLVYEGFTINRDRPAKSGLGGGSSIR